MADEPPPAGPERWVCGRCGAHRVVPPGVAPGPCRVCGSPDAIRAEPEPED